MRKLQGRVILGIVIWCHGSIPEIQGKSCCMRTELASFTNPQDARASLVVIFRNEKRGKLMINNRSALHLIWKVQGRKSFFVYSEDALDSDHVFYVLDNGTSLQSLTLLAYTVLCFVYPLQYVAVDLELPLPPMCFILYSPSQTSPILLP